MRTPTTSAGRSRSRQSSATRRTSSSTSSGDWSWLRNPLGSRSRSWRTRPGSLAISLLSRFARESSSGPAESGTSSFARATRAKSPTRAALRAWQRAALDQFRNRLSGIHKTVAANWQATAASRQGRPLKEPSRTAARPASGSGCRASSRIWSIPAASRKESSQKPAATWSTRSSPSTWQSFRRL